MQKENIDISVIIPTYNRAERLHDVLQVWNAVDKVTSCSYELIFSDDGSEDDTVSILQSCKELPIKVIANKHGGASSARNNAIKHAIGNRIIFAGDDIYPANDFIQKHYDIGQEYGDNVAILGLVDWHPDQNRNYLLDHITEVGNEQFSFNRLKDNAFTDFRHFYTCNVSVSNKMLGSVETKFDERFYKVNFEDTELSYRLFNNGMKIVYRPDIFGYHYHEYKVDKFCVRQSTAGEMAVVFQKLHPEVDSMLGISKACNIYLAYKKSENVDQGLISVPKIESVLGVCEAFEDELKNNMDETYGSVIKRMLSLVYEKLFKLKFVEGVLITKFPDDTELVKNYLLSNYFDAEFKRVLLAEYIQYAINNQSNLGLLSSGALKRSRIKNDRHEKIKEIMKTIYEDDQDYKISKTGLWLIAKSRFVAHLKKYYLLRQLKYKYDWVRRHLHIS